MTQWNKREIVLENGVHVEAQSPYIISASRSTDIPAFYSDWFFHRMKVGYSAWTNPFNRTKSYISYQDTKFIVFWSKNPKPLLKHIDYLKEKNIECYIQFTLNDYEDNGLETGVPPLEDRINTFKKLVSKLGKGHVIWRFDPMILTDSIGIDDLLFRVISIANKLKDYTEKLVFSYADIASYIKVQKNLIDNNIKYREWTKEDMEIFAYKLSEYNKIYNWNFKLATCGELVDLSKYGIEHNKCIDDDLIIRFKNDDKVLMDFLKVDILENKPLFNDENKNTIILLDNGKYALKKRINKDKGQRTACGCVVSKDIGQYNTCIHLCEYCYANNNKSEAKNNYNKHLNNPLSETITGE